MTSTGPSQASIVTPGHSERGCNTLVGADASAPDELLGAVGASYTGRCRPLQ